MNQSELANRIRASQCRVFGAEYASNDAHRAVLAVLANGFDEPDATLLCEPSLARSTRRPPDIVLIDLRAGVHVIECKGVTLEQITSLEPGGNFRICYDGVTVGKNPFAQVRNAMFDVKDAVQRVADGDLTLPFQYWVVLATVSRAEWQTKWGDECFQPPELLFQDDLPSLPARLRSHGKAALERHDLRIWPTDQIQSVWRAFGDSSVLFPRPRSGRRDASRKERWAISSTSRRRPTRHCRTNSSIFRSKSGTPVRS